MGAVPLIRRPVLLVGLATLLAVVLTIASHQSAQATHNDVRVRGDANDNAFRITRLANGDVQICTTPTFCFTRTPSTVDLIVIEALEGDDTLTIRHGTGLVTNSANDLPITFVGGTGDDRVTICDQECTEPLRTELRPGATPTELFLTQQLSGRAMSLTVEQATFVTDTAPGDAVVNGTTGDDVVTHGADGTGGRLTVNGASAYRFAGKRSLRVDTSTGADRVTLEAVAGLGSTRGPCPREDGAGTAPVCVDSDGTADDELRVPASATDLALAPTAAGDAVLAGLDASVELRGIDTVDLALSQRDVALTVVGTSGDDALQIAPSDTAGSLALSGQFGGSATADPFPLARVRVSGPAPTRLRLQGGEGDDEIVHQPTSRDDALVLRPTNTDALDGRPDTVCTAAGTDCLTAAVDALDRYRLAAAGVERYELSGGDGADELEVAGELAPATTWRGGNGTDGLRFDGSGTPTKVDLGSGTVTQQPVAAGVPTGSVTVSEAETLDVSSGGSSVTVVGTAGDDTFAAVPTGPSTATITRDGDPRNVRLAATAAVTVDPATGADDRVTVSATAAADEVAVNRASALAVQVGTSVPVRVTDAARAVTLMTGNGNDRVSLSGATWGGELTVDGGNDTGGDVLVTAQPLHDVGVSLDGMAGSGQIAPGGTPVGFVGVEALDVEGDGSGALTVAGSDAADVVTQRGDTVASGSTEVRFSRFADLRLPTGAAPDQLHLHPSSTSAQRIEVDGGDATDVLHVAGNALGETLTYRPGGPASGEVLVQTTPVVAFVGTDQVVVDGATSPPGGDRLVVDTPALDGTIVLEPGATFDSGTVRFRDATGAATTAPPLAFGRLGAGSVTFADDGRHDLLQYTGTPLGDAFAVTSEPATGAPTAATVTLGVQVPVRAPGAHTLRLEGGGGDDVVSVPSRHPFPGLDGGPGIVVAGSAGDGDRLALSGSGAPLTVDYDRAWVVEDGHAAVAHSGLSVIDLAAGGAGVDVQGTPGPDALVYTPTGGAAGRLDDLAGGAPQLRLTGVGERLTADPGEGADAVRVDGRSAADDILVHRQELTEVSVSGLQTLSVPTTAESLQIGGGTGEDRFRVTGSGGPASLSVDGGAPVAAGDRLELHSANVAVTFGTDASTGRLDSDGGPMAFAAMEVVDVVGDGTGGLTVRGTDAPDVLTIGSAAVPAVQVNGGAPVTYGGYPDVTLDGRAGGDRLTVSYAALGEVDAIHGVGGAPALGDEVLVEDSLGTARTITVTPTGPAASRLTLGGHRTVLLTEEAETLRIDGRGTDDQLVLVTPAGAQDVRADPADAADAGALRVASLQPLAYQQLGAAGTVVVQDADGLRADRLTVHGAGVSDRFTTASSGEVRRAGSLPLATPGVQDLVLLGYDGDDAFSVSGPVPFRSTTLDGGSPDAGDSAVLEGPLGDVVTDLGTGTVTGYGGTVHLPGIWSLQTDVGGRALATVGTPLDDAFCYDPQAPRDGRLFLVGAPTSGAGSSRCVVDLRATNVLHSFADVGRFVVDPAGGSDEVLVNGTTDRDLVTVHGTYPTAEVTVHPRPEEGGSFRLPVEVVVDTTESLVVASDSGSDSFDVTAYDNPSPRFTLYGESPTTMRMGDNLVFRDGTGRAHLSNTNSHTKEDGTVTATYRSSGTVVRADYHGVENVTLYRDPKVG